MAYSYKNSVQQEISNRSVFQSSQLYKEEFFDKAVNGCRSLTNFTKCFILDN